MTKIRKDFTIKPYVRKAEPDAPFWQVVGGGVSYGVYRSAEEATKIADALNIDPYHLERGHTRADRAAQEKAKTA